MARSFGRVFTSIWDDKEFRALTTDARLMYVFLVSQPDLDHAGVIPLRIRRWAGLLGRTTAEVRKWLAELDSGRFTVTDEDTEELLVRSLIRRDEIWKQPNVFKSAAASAAACASVRIKAVLFAELRRLDVSPASKEIQRTRADLLTLLEPFGRPSPTPPEPPQGASDEAPPEIPGSTEPDSRAESGNAAGDKGSGRVPEAIAKGIGEPTGKGVGEGNCPVPLTAFPLKPSPSPSPRSAPQPMVPLWPAAVPDAKPEEGEEPPGEETPDIAALIAEVRKIRPAWSSMSVGRALAEPSVKERPWPVVRAAMLIVARDPGSQHPGRLAHEGPWWAEAERACSRHAPAPKPDHCGQCDPRTRMREDPATGIPSYCPECHPNAQQEAS